MDSRRTREPGGDFRKNYLRGLPETQAQPMPSTAAGVKFVPHDIAPRRVITPNVAERAISVRARGSGNIVRQQSAHERKRDASTHCVVTNMPAHTGTHSITYVMRNARNKLQNRRMELNQLVCREESDPTIVELVRALKSTGEAATASFDDQYGVQASRAGTRPRSQNGQHLVSNTNVDPVSSFRANVKRNTNHMLVRSGRRRWRQDFRDPDALTGLDPRRKMLLRLGPRGQSGGLHPSGKENERRKAGVGNHRGGMFFLHIDGTGEGCCKSMPVSRGQGIYGLSQRQQRPRFVVSQSIQTEPEPTTQLVAEEKPVHDDVSRPEKMSQCIQTETEIVVEPKKSGSPRTTPATMYRRPFLLVEEFDTAHAATSEEPLLRRSYAVSGDVLVPSQNNADHQVKLVDAHDPAHVQRVEEENEHPKNTTGPANALGGTVQIGARGHVWKLEGASTTAEVMAQAADYAFRDEQNRHTDREEGILGPTGSTGRYVPLAELLPDSSDEAEGSTTVDGGESLEELQDRHMRDDFDAIRQKLERMQRRMKKLDHKADVIDHEFADMNGVFLNVVERHARAMSAWKRVDNTMSAAAAESARWEYDSKLKRILGSDFETGGLNEDSGGSTAPEPGSEQGFQRSNDGDGDLVSASSKFPNEEGTHHSSVASSDPDNKAGTSSSGTVADKEIDITVRDQPYYHYHNNYLDSPYFRSQTRPLEETPTDEGSTAAARQDVEETARLAQELQDEMQLLLNLDGNTSNSASDGESSASIISYRPPSPPRRQQHLGNERAVRNRGRQDSAGGQTSTHDAITLEPIQSYDFKGKPVASVAVVAAAQGEGHNLRTQENV